MNKFIRLNSVHEKILRCREIVVGLGRGMDHGTRGTVLPLVVLSGMAKSGPV